MITLNEAEYVLADLGSPLTLDQFAAEVSRLLATDLQPYERNGYRWFSGLLGPDMLLDVEADDMGLESDPFPLGVATMSVGDKYLLDEDRQMQKEAARSVFDKLSESTDWRLALVDEDGLYALQRPALQSA
ncbi:MAG: hypothetical protein U0990_01355 [Candidatus Nanopelagicales bacterium]|nr:hypothetical protein [Candidatus Nanopelagicales bacterium]MDZ4248717.1 hypothetical protein [Candidatus Nanopelagicales bacterium]